MKPKHLLLLKCIVCILSIHSILLLGNEPETIVTDFQVNESMSTNFPGTDPVIGVADNGDYIVAWLDKRSGQKNIYAQRFRSDGTPLGDNFLVNDDTKKNNRDHFPPAIAVDTSGDFVIVWADNRVSVTSPRRLYFQRYNKDGQPQGANKAVNMDLSDSFTQSSPAVAYADSSHIIIVLNKYSNIYMRKIDSQGNYLSELVKVNEEPVAATQQDAAIACNSNGSYVIAWQDIDYAINRPKICYRRFDTNDTPLGDQLRVDDASLGEKFVQREAAVALNDSGEFIFSWTDGRNDNLDIFAQRFDADGQTLGGNFKVNDDPGDLDQRYSALAINPDGGCLITWANTLHSGDVYGQLISELGEPVSGNFLVNDDTSGIQTNPDVGIDENDDFLITWQDNRNFGISYDIYLQKILSHGAPYESNFLIIDNTWNDNQNKPRVSSFSNGNRIVTWWDGYADIYAQIYDDGANPVGENFKVNGDNRAGPEDVAAGADNRALVVWTNIQILDNVYHYYIQGQMVSSDGTVSGSLINIDTLDAGSGFVSVDYNNGTYIVAWHESQPPDYGDIYAQRLDDSGIPLGPSFKVNDDIGTTVQTDPDIAINDNGDFLLVWQDNRENDSNIFAQIYNSDGETINNNFRINYSPSDSFYFSPCVAATDSGHFVVAYGSSSINGDISLRFLEADGSFIGNSIRINDEPGSRWLANPALAAGDSSRIVVTWEDEHEGENYHYYYTLRGQRFIFNKKVSTNFTIAEDVGSDQNNSAISLWGRTIFTTWEDNRIEKIVPDIWANVLDFGKASVTSLSNTYRQPLSFTMAQNYPNPFNPATTIEYGIPERDHISLKVYDLLGQEVMTLVNDYLDAGLYSVDWNGKNENGMALSSGFYVYRLETGSRVLSKKMLLLK